MSASDFYSLPAEVKDRVMAAACEQHHVADFFDLPANVRHDIYENAGL